MNHAPQPADLIIRPRPVVAANDNDPPQLSDYDKGYRAGWLARVVAELKGK